MKDQESLAVVFDCNVYLQAAARGKSIAAECLRLVENNSIQMFLSEDILTEVADVLNRPEIRDYFQTLTDEIVEAFVLKLRKNGQLIHDVPKVFNYSRDPDDEPYINLAVEVRADYIVSRDKDLLDLMSAFTAESKEFRQRFRFLKVLEPLDFINKLKNQSGETQTQ